MANRRKDMWRLLYNLVNRNEAELTDVFNFVGDILCKESSLIRPYSKREINNRFQDTFILWLINKFVKSLTEQRSEDCLLKNIKLQQKILTSCLINRPVLFARLVGCYVQAISELCIEVEEPTALAAAEQQLQINAFVCECSCLLEIDANFNFPTVHVAVADIDTCVNSLLLVLRHALGIGYDIYPALFARSLKCIFQALKECEMGTKLLCLRYCHALYAVAYELNDSLMQHYELCQQAVTLIWQQLPLWLHADCLEQHELVELLEVTLALLAAQMCHSAQLQSRPNLWQLNYKLLEYVNEVAKLPSLCARELEGETLNWTTLNACLVECLLATDVASPSLTFVQVKTLLQTAQKHTELLRLLATLDNGTNGVYILHAFQQSLIELLPQATHKRNDLQSLQALLNAVVYLEQQQCQRKQIALFTAQANVPLVELQLQLPHVGALSGMETSPLQSKVEIFLRNAQHQCNAAFQSLELQIAGLLLRSATMRGGLNISMQRALVDYVARPLHNILNTTTTASENQRECAQLAMQILTTLHVDANANIFAHLCDVCRQLGGKLFQKQNNKNKASIVCALREIYCENLLNLIVFGLLTPTQILKDYLTAPKQQPPNIVAALLRAACCGADLSLSCALQLSPYAERQSAFQSVHFMCHKCKANEFRLPAVVLDDMRNLDAILLPPPKRKPNNICSSSAALTCEWLCISLFTDAQFGFLAHHLTQFDITAQHCYQVLSTANIAALHVPAMRAVLPQFVAHDAQFLMQMAKLALQQTLRCLQTQQMREQTQTLALIEACVLSSELSEQWLFHFFKLTFFFLVHCNSCVVQQAVLCANELCARHNVQPIQLWNWYKRDALSLVVKLAIYAYLRKGMRLLRSLKAFTKMLGFSCVQEFVCKYYRLLTTMILPYCVKAPQCKGLLMHIAKITRKPVSTIFVVSFLRIYTHIYLTEEADVGNRCIELIVKCTDSSLKKLMQTDVKQTVSEFLIYFNRNPKFVMQAFQCLLLHANAQQNVASLPSTSSGSSSEFAKFIADRFLGVITYFETCLAEANFEKPLKAEALYSLGQIMRYVGAQHVTQFRFKIIAMLSFVLSLPDMQLQNICLKVWNIFLRIVNIEELGPSLSRIVASLQPLLSRAAAEVNAIYEYLIVTNDSLLGAHIPDLYFLEQLPHVSSGTRQCVARQTELLLKDDACLLPERLGFLYKQISNEHVQVRIYGLAHLRQLFAAQRDAVNQLVLSEMRVHPLIEQIVENLITGCRHEDRNLQLACGNCLGELGAIDPSYMHTHRSAERLGAELPLSVHTDDFAVLALTELCRAYQFQKDTKYVDNFSLAIQETLSVCGVSPGEQKKLHVWQAIPLRLRQVMEPLLNSCYTASRREVKCHDQPIFNSSHCRTYEEWAFLWAARLIDSGVQRNDTKHLLNAYKPSMRRDKTTLALFFPYVLLHALQDCRDEQLAHIREEFDAVFSHASCSLAATPAYETSVGFKEFLSTKYTAERSADGEYRKQSEALESITRNCAKLCSEQIDFLQRWQREWQRVNVVGGKVNSSGQHYRRVEEFVQHFDKLQIARANYNAGEYARALLYLEQYIECEAQTRLQEQLAFLIEIYGQLTDPDSVEGAVHVKQTNLTLAEEILVNRIVERPQDAMICYEQLLSSDAAIDQDHIRGMINCYLRMDTPETALLITDGLWQKLTEQYTDDYFKECRAELLWRLGNYDGLQQLLEDAVMRRKTHNWHIQCAEAFVRYRQASTCDEFATQLDVIRAHVLSDMRSCSGGVQHTHSYAHCYEDVVKLHLLNELGKHRVLLEQLSQAMVAGEVEACVPQLRQFFVEGEARLCVLQPVVRVMEPVLCSRRNLLLETQRLLRKKVVAAMGDAFLPQVCSLIDDEVGRLWLRSAQLQRASGSLQQAQLCIMKAEAYQPPALCLEKAQLLWQKGEQTHTFKLLEQQLEKLESQCESDIRKLAAEPRALYAEAKFLQATFNAESLNICSELNVRHFKEAIAGNKHAEKCYVQLAQYLERIYDACTREQQQADSARKLIMDIMLNYAKSLRCGYENVYQSLPRLLSYWLDLSSQCASMQESASAASDPSYAVRLAGFQDLVKKMNELIHNCSGALPTSLFYTAFSQLLSRICHPSLEVFNVLRTIVIRLVEQFPQQSLWMLLPVYKSSYTQRIKRCKQIFTDSRLAKPEFQKLLVDFNMLAERLIELTNKEVSMDRSYELSGLVKQLPKLFEDAQFSEILLPFEKYMQASFPVTPSSSSLKLSLSSSNSGAASDVSIPTNPFPYPQIYICGVDEVITVLRSAARPKKISIQCSDGRSYEVMVKPKDDLRKDFRLMEFNGLLKRYLHQDAQARQRRLHIRTYAAIPFNEECGLVEWLPNLNSYRAICTSIYRTRGLGLTDRVLRTCAVPKTDPAEKKRKVFLDVLLPNHPPVFQDWLRQRFPTPHSWHEARCTYVKTIAVMSMVGYILGLGDRHGENVLFDETNGDAVHVDFNCLFNQGETFAYPELVPFRLTRNMIFAMGPLGIEGMYRKSCEITLRVLKQQSKTLISVLRPFVYDFVALSRNQSNRQKSAELTDPKAMQDVRRIEERLKGYVKKTLANSMPLSTEGQVNFLIAEATDVDNLAAMYIGWGSFI